MNELTPDMDTLSLIRAHFEGPEGLIERPFRQDAAFRSLCEDYQACAEALARWNCSAAVAAVDRRKEYADLLAQLDREIRTWLRAAGQRQNRPESDGQTRHP